MKNIYDPLFIKKLFNEMAGTYGRVNLFASFGFCERWRRQCVDLARIKPGMTVCDMMTGRGECWMSIDRKLENRGHILAVDFSSEMCRAAGKSANDYTNLSISILEEDVLENTLPSSSVDCVVSSFGLKTFSDDQKDRFAKEIKRILKTGGCFSLLEISVPENNFLKIPYLFYLKYVIPLLGVFFLGNPANYRFLGVYTEQFKNCRTMYDLLRSSGLTVSFKPFFFGCATAVWGVKS